MPSSLLSRSARLAAAIALGCATTITGAGVAVADGTHDDRDRDVIHVSIEKEGVEAPHEAKGGLVTFQVHTDDPGGRQLQLVHLHHGVSHTKFFGDLTDAINENDPATAAMGIRNVAEEADVLGGTFVTPKVPETLTEEIGSGDVILLDFTAFFQDPAHPVFKTVEFEGNNGNHLAPFPRGIVIQENTADGPRFDANNVDDADAPILVHNAADELHEMEIQPVKPGTTDADLKAFFDSLQTPNPLPPPFTGPPAGLGAISPGRTALIQAKNLKPGTYALLCFIPDDQLGIPHAFLGMHKVVQLH